MIVHLDADAFFASVEQAADPKLRGKPVAVGGDRRGIIASASYEARKLGIYTPMPTARARKLCPRLIVLPGDFEKYERFSRFMFSYAYDFTPEVEIASIDEGYFDLRGQHKHPPREVAETIRRAIRQSLKIVVSEGIAANKLVSQVASKLRKPACFLEVPDGEERSFLAPLANKWLPGVGPKLAGVLNTAGLAIIEQIAGTPADLLSLLVGSYAPQLRAFANGVDERPVVPEKPDAKSYGEQDTFAEDVTDDAFILAKLRSIADRLAAKVREDGKSFRTVTVKLRYNDMQDVSRALSLDEPSDLEQDIYPVLPLLVRKAWERRVSIRMVAMRLTGIYGGIFRSELALDEQSRKRENERRLAGVLDSLRGEHSIMRGHDLWLKQRAGKARADIERKPLEKRVTPAANRVRDFVPLNVKSHFSFLDSALSIPSIMETARAMGAKALAITDPNLHGAVEFFTAARDAGIKPIIGAEIVSDGRALHLYVENATGYANLCRLLSVPVVCAALLTAHRDGLIAVDAARVALPEIRYRSPAERQKFAIIQSIRTLTRLHEAHAEKRTGDLHWPTAPEVAARWSDEAIRATHEIAERCEFAFEFGRLRFPRFTPEDGSTPHDFLACLAFDGLRRRYGDAARLHDAQLREELGIIAEVGYEEYFLTTWEILQECQRRGIAWITRGSAADSLVCYCLGISGVCPIRFELYFRRFLNRERMALNKLPDIDIDFAHDRKDDVVDLIFERYGPHHAAIVGGFNTYQGRSAVADIAKVLGASEFQIRRLTEHVPRTTAAHVAEAVATAQECRESQWSEEPYKTALEMAAVLDGFPRYPKMHPCGVVLSRDPIAALTPTFIEREGLCDHALRHGCRRAGRPGEDGHSRARRARGDPRRARAAAGARHHARPRKSRAVGGRRDLENARLGQRTRRSPYRKPGHDLARADVQCAGHRLPHRHRLGDSPRRSQWRKEDAIRPPRAGLGAGGIRASESRHGVALDLRRRRLRGTHSPNLRSLRRAPGGPRGCAPPRTRETEDGHDRGNRARVHRVGAYARPHRRRNRPRVGTGRGLPGLRLLPRAQHRLRRRGLPRCLAEAVSSRRVPRLCAQQRQRFLLHARLHARMSATRHRLFAARRERLARELRTGARRHPRALARGQRPHYRDARTLSART